MIDSTALIDGRWTADLRSALTACFPPVCEILQMPLGAPRTQRHMIFFRLPVSCTTDHVYSDRFIKITF